MPKNWACTAKIKIFTKILELVILHEMLILKNFDLLYENGSYLVIFGPIRLYCLCINEPHFRHYQDNFQHQVREFHYKAPP